MRQRTYSDTRPEKGYDIENVENGKCTVLFFDDIQEESQEIPNVENEETTAKTMYSYDLYSLVVTYRENLAEEIERNLESWLIKAKEEDYNEAAAEIRKKRDELLASTDWTQMADTALPKAKQNAYKVYRQALRDVPEQPGFPYDVEFPVLEQAGE